MKIIMIAPPFTPVTPNLDEYGGVELCVANLAEQFDKMGHEVVLFAGQHGDKNWVPKHGRLYGFGHKLIWDQVSFDYYGSCIRNSDAFNEIADADIINDNQATHPCRFIKLKHINENYVVSCHNQDIVPSTLLPTYNWRIVMSSFHVAKVVRRVLHEKYNMRCIHPCPAKPSKYSFSKDHGDRLLYLGRLFSAKGPHRAVRLAERAGISIDIVGGSSDDNTDYKQKIIDMCEHSNYAVYHGQVSFKEKVEFYQKARAVIIPSTEYYDIDGDNFKLWTEPLGNISIEAGLCGTPSIVSPSGGWAETICHGYNGFLANTDDEFITAIKHIDEIDRRNCRKRAMYFSPENVAKRYIELFENVIEGDEW